MSEKDQVLLTWVKVLGEYKDDMRAWIELLRLEGIEGAFPRDGYCRIDGDSGTLHGSKQTAHFDDNVFVGDRILIGSMGDALSKIAVVEKFQTYGANRKFGYWIQFRVLEEK